MTRLVLALALAFTLAACDSGDSSSTPTPTPTGNGLITATVSGAAAFDATQAFGALQNGFDVYGTTADGRYVLLTTLATTPGTYALGQNGTDFGYTTGYGTASAANLTVTSGSLTITEYTAQGRARGTFTFSGTLGGQTVTLTGGTFNVVQGANTP